MSEAEWAAWDKQLQKDLQAGRLDKLLNEVREQHLQGLTFPVREGKRPFVQNQKAGKAIK